MGLAPLSFVGVSKFSEDFQKILQRAVTIASVPLRNVQNQQTDNLQRKVVVGSLQESVAAFATSLTGLANVGDSKAVVATSSDATKVAVTGTSASNPAVYTVSEITSVAGAASETSLDGYADSNATTVSSTGTVRLTVGSDNFTITLTPAQNNLVGLRNAINELGAGVTASILTTGTGPDPNYLVVSANATGATTLAVVDDPDGAATALLTSTNQGANANFKLNGISVSKTTNLVNDVVPGVTFNIVGTTDPGETVTLTLASDPGKLATALRDIVVQYNAINELADKQIGEAAGLLSGDFLIRTLKNDLRELAGFQGDGASIRGLADLGLNLDTNGTMSFDEDAFSLLSETQLGEAFTFVGTSASGLGSLIARFTSLSNPVTGLFKLQQDQYDSTDRRLSSELDILNERVTSLQVSLSQRLQATDTLLAQLESQQTVLEASLASLSLVLFGKNDS